MNNGVLVIIFVAVTIGILIYVAKTMTSKQASEPVIETEKEFCERFFMGSCLSGLPNMARAFPLVFCGVTENDFVIRMGTQGSEIGRIPRGNIRTITIVNEHCLKIDWNDALGAPFSTVFDFGKDRKTKLDLIKDSFNKWQKASV